MTGAFSYRSAVAFCAGLWMMASVPPAWAQAPAPAEPAPGPTLAKPQIEIYGRLHMSADGVSLQDSPTSTDYLQFTSNTSLIGFRGSHDLGPVKALWQVESNVNVANGVSSAIGVGSRDTFVGLWSPYGAVKAGFFYSPYYYAVASLDPLTWTVADFRSVIHNTGWGNRVEFSTRLTNAVQYTSPNFSGFEFQALYANPERSAAASDTPGGKQVAAYNPANANTGDGDVLGGIYALSLTYKQGPLYAAAGYEVHNNVNRVDDGLGIQQEQAFELGASYTLPTKTTITAMYENISRGGADSIRSRPLALFASVKQDWGKESFIGTFGYAGKSNAPNAQDDGGFFGLGYYHHFHRTTDVYLAFAKAFNSSAAQWGLGTQGHGTTINPRQPGNGPMALSVGLIYRFGVGL